MNLVHGSAQSASLALYSQYAADQCGVVDVPDMTKVTRVILLLDAETTESDVNLDGVADVFDVTKIARIIRLLD